MTPQTDADLAALVEALQASLSEERARRARLERELTEATDRQAATGAILSLIAASPADVQPVFEAIAEGALRLFGAWSTSVYRYENGLIQLVAARGGRPGSSEAFAEELATPHPPDPDIPYGRAVLTGTVQHIADVDADPTWSPLIRDHARLRGFHSVAMVPMLRRPDLGIVIGIARIQADGFTDAELALLRTFADQAMIAVDNARLLGELQARNADLTAALEQQTATSEILRVISSSPTSVQPVFADGATPDQLETVHAAYPTPPGRTSVAAQAILERRVIAIADVQSDVTEPGRVARARAIGYRSLVAGRRGDRRHQRRALRRPGRHRHPKRAPVHRARDAQPRVAGGPGAADRDQRAAQGDRHAVRLCEADRAFIFRSERGVLRIVAAQNVPPEMRAFVEKNPMVPGRQRSTARAAFERRTIHIPDVQADPEFTYGADLRGPRRSGPDVEPVQVVDILAEGAYHGPLRDVLVAARWRKRGWDVGGLEAGVSQGYATIGAIGFEGRVDYGAIGTVTNLAARLCGEATGGQILVSARIATAVEGLADAESVGPLTLKGLARPIPTWSVRGLR